MKYKIVPIEKLIPLERVFPIHLKNLEEMIDKDGFILKAIIADKTDGIILDGSHRYVYLKKKGFKEVPVYLIDYDSEDVRVGTHLSHRFLIDDDSSDISKSECRQRALSGNLFPPRTTRHFFTFRKADISLPLYRLKSGEPSDVSDLIYDVDISAEIEHNKKYISEINEEISIIIQYLEEVSNTKRYLSKQIELMDQLREIVFFPGKFHPPHIGHIQTILHILPKYRKVIIGVTEDKPPDTLVTDTNSIVTALKSLLIPFENVEVHKIKGILTNKKSIEGLPSFDVLLSGNKDVLSWADNIGINSRYVPRSGSNMFSGTKIRESYE